MSLPPEMLIEILREALLLAVAIVLPWLGAMWLLSAFLGAVQSSLQLHDPLVMHVPRVLLGVALLLALGGWMARPVAALATRVFSLGLSRSTDRRAGDGSCVFAHVEPPMNVLSASEIDAASVALGDVLFAGGRVLSREVDRVVLGDALGAFEASLDIDVVLHPGDLVVLSLRKIEAGDAGQQLVATVVERHTPRSPDGAGRDVARFLYGGIGQHLRARDHVVRAIRSTLVDQGFVELQPPIVVPSPGLDVHLDAVSVEGRDGYLITSPEYQMKRALVGGMPRCFAITPCFRSDEAGTWHNPEFVMLEWYRAFAGYEAIMSDTEGLVVAAVQALRPNDAIVRIKGREISLARPFDRITVADAFLRFAGLTADDTLRLASDDEETFFRHLIDEVEPALAAMRRPVFLVDYPASQASLARRKPSDPRWAERFELYVAGVELCNGFGELTDPIEQRARLEHDQEERRRRGLAVYPIDERFLEALEAGLPPCAGNALGLDRLVALAVGAKSIGDVQAFPVNEL